MRSLMLASDAPLSAILRFAKARQQRGQQVLRRLEPASSSCNAPSTPEVLLQRACSRGSPGPAGAARCSPHAAATISTNRRAQDALTASPSNARYALTKQNYHSVLIFLTRHPTRHARARAELRATQPPRPALKIKHAALVPPASAFLDALPVAPTLRLSHRDFRSALHLRLGLLEVLSAAIGLPGAVFPGVFPGVFPSAMSSPKAPYWR